MAEREFRVITLYFTSTVVSYAPGQLLWDLQKRFLEDLWQLSTCHLQNPPVSFAGRFTLVKGSFGGMDNRCQYSPSCSMTAQSKYSRRRKARFWLPFFVSQLRAVTLALPVVKASLRGHPILIMPNIILTIAYISRQGVIISSNSIRRPSARWTIDLSGKAIQLEAN